mmetsp:Transcript_7495/g.13602  ORF Transcript_7495/g.13602 Transcript_7495/m.13602 type:complete len:248 (-) Transcript_7495:1823-2566(-)
MRRGELEQAEEKRKRERDPKRAKKRTKRAEKLHSRASSGEEVSDGKGLQTKDESAQGGDTFQTKGDGIEESAQIDTMNKSKKHDKVEIEDDSAEGCVIKFIKNTLHEWGNYLEARSEDAKATADGRTALRNFNQCKESIRPFVKLLKKKRIQAEVLKHVSSIVARCEEGEYVKAGEEYVRLAIGNAPWPIGVTMIGIHDRTSRERIKQANVAHVMNDEAQRKYITSLKRIMTFHQTLHPSVPSKMVL